MAWPLIGDHPNPETRMRSWRPNHQLLDPGGARRGLELEVRPAGVVAASVSGFTGDESRRERSQLVVRAIPLDQNGEPSGRGRESRARRNTNLQSLRPGRYRVVLERRGGAEPEVLDQKDVTVKARARVAVELSIR